MTYLELAEYISLMSKEQQQQKVTLYNEVGDYFLPIDGFGFTKDGLVCGDLDILQYPVLKIYK